ncbi:hypothetical protein B2G51_10560 [Leptospira santarosai]|nr:hypothetical protein B2G51_10560 [Leptospira santarosai]
MNFEFGDPSPTNGDFMRRFDFKIVIFGFSKSTLKKFKSYVLTNIEISFPPTLSLISENS